MGSRKKVQATLNAGGGVGSLFGALEQFGARLQGPDSPVILVVASLALVAAIWGVNAYLAFPFALCVIVIHVAWAEYKWKHGNRR
jgi:hypothetical protein